MKKEYIQAIIIIIALAIFIIMDKLGLTLISQIGKCAVTIAILIISLPNIKAMNKKLFATVMTITIVPGLVMAYAMIFVTKSSYLMWGSFVCFLLSFPIGMTIIYFYRKKEQSKVE